MSESHSYGLRTRDSLIHSTDPPENGVRTIDFGLLRYSVSNWFPLRTVVSFIFGS